MAGGSRPKRAPTASATWPAGTIGVVGAAAAGGVTGGAAAAGGGGETPPPGDVRLAPGEIEVGLPGVGTLGIGLGGTGASSPGRRLRDWADAPTGQASANTHANATHRRPAGPRSPPDPCTIATVFDRNHGDFKPDDGGRMSGSSRAK